MRSFVRLITVFALFLLPAAAADTLPARLTDDAFWRMISEFSEKSGSFRFEYMSNEQEFQYVIPRLKQGRTPGSVYVGVGPEQNFTYIAALEPKMAFIVDIRRDNMIEHLVYKAAFELSANRAEFLSRLFSRKAPSGLKPASSAAALFQAFRNSPPDGELYRTNLAAIKDCLIHTHHFRLSAEDQNSIDYVYRVFFEAANAFSRGAGRYPGFGRVTYADLMTATDEAGRARSYLASEDNFQAVRELQQRNMIVPLVGDFAGAKALRNVAEYVRQHGAVLGAFYTSNVEQYLFEQDQDWRRFLSNAAAFPADSSSMFIRSAHFSYDDRGQLYSQFNRGRFIQLLSPMAEVAKAFQSGKIERYEDLIRMSK